MKGKIKFFNRVKGFGFITKEDGSDVFFHYTGLSEDVRDSLQDGASVYFEVESGKKGDYATNIQLT